MIFTAYQIGKEQNKMKTKTNKLNWNSLTDEQQSFIDNIVNDYIMHKYK